MKSPLYELLGMQATNPGSGGGAAAIAPGSGTSSLQTRFSIKRPAVRQMWTKNLAAGFFQPIWNSGHDTTRNYRFNVAAATLAFQLAWDMEFGINPNEMIVPTISGSGAGIESACMLIEYEELGGMQGAYIDPNELSRRYSGIQTTVDLALTGTGAGWTGALALTGGTTNLLQATREYAVLGLTTDIACAAISILGPCTGNYRYGCPGDTTQVERQHQIFKLASTISGMPMIPVLNASDGPSTQLAFLQDGTNISPNVTLHLALLNR